MHPGHLDAPEVPGGVAAGDTRPAHGGAQLGRLWQSGTVGRVNGAGRAGLGRSPRPEEERRWYESRARDLNSRTEQVSSPPPSLHFPPRNERRKKTQACKIYFLKKHFFPLKVMIDPLTIKVFDERSSSFPAVKVTWHFNHVCCSVRTDCIAFVTQFPQMKSFSQK